MTLIYLAAIAVGAPFTVLAIGMVISVLAAPWIPESRRDSADASAQSLISLARAMRSGGGGERDADANGATHAPDWLATDPKN